MALSLHLECTITTRGQFASYCPLVIKLKSAFKEVIHFHKILDTTALSRKSHVVEQK